MDGGMDGCPTGQKAEQCINTATPAPAFSTQTMNFTIVSGPVMQGGQCCYVLQAKQEYCG